MNLNSGIHIEIQKLCNSFEKKENIENYIFDTFDNFFLNKDNLRLFSRDYLIRELVKYLKIHTNQTDNNIEMLLSIYKEAMNVNKAETIRVLKGIHNDMTILNNKLISYKKCEYYTSIFYDNVVNKFNVAEFILEGYILTHIKTILYLKCIIENKDTYIKEIKNNTFGNAYQKYISNTDLKNILIQFDFADISLNQWRNIMSHKDFIITGDCVTVFYGNKKQYKKVLCGIETVNNLYNNINRFAALHELVFDFFTLDNVSEFSDLKSCLYEEVRDELKEQIISIYLSSIYFRMNDIEEVNEEVILTITDESFGIEDDKKIGYLFFTFLYLSDYFSAQNYKIKFFDSNENCMVILSLKEEDLKLVDEDINKLTQLVKIQKYK